MEEPHRVRCVLSVNWQMTKVRLFARYGYYSIACASQPNGSIDPRTLMIRARHVARPRKPHSTSWRPLTERRYVGAAI